MVRAKATLSKPMEGGTRPTPLLEKNENLPPPNEKHSATATMKPQETGDMQTATPCCKATDATLGGQTPETGQRPDTEESLTDDEAKQATENMPKLPGHRKSKQTTGKGWKTGWNWNAETTTWDYAMEEIDQGRMEKLMEKDKERTDWHQQTRIRSLEIDTHKIWCMVRTLKAREYAAMENKVSDVQKIVNELKEEKATVQYRHHPSLIEEAEKKITDLLPEVQKLCHTLEGFGDPSHRNSPSTTNNHMNVYVCTVL